MIITCPSCEKKFEVNSNLIPKKGRILRCGSCNHEWFYNPKPQTSSQVSETAKTDRISELSKNNEEIKNVKKQKNDKIKKNSKSSTFGLGRILSFLVVIIISFIAFILVVETFKVPLSKIFPGLEFVLYSLFETIKDIILFIKNLLF